MSTVKAANLQNTGSGAPTFKNSSGTEIGQLAKAWVSFKGTGTVAIREDFNVSSITDHDTGKYTVTFTNAVADGNFAAVVSGINLSDNAVPVGGRQAPTTTTLRVYMTDLTNFVDVDYVHVVVFR